MGTLRQVKLIINSLSVLEYLFFYINNKNENLEDCNDANNNC